MAGDGLRIYTRFDPVAGFGIYYWDGLCIHLWRTVVVIEWS